MLMAERNRIDSRGLAVTSKGDVCPVPGRGVWAGEGGAR